MSDVKATLKPNGTLELGWKGNNPPRCNGVIYQIYRKIDAAGTYDYLGGTGSRKFVDVTLPSGVPSVLYRIMGTRSTAVGDVAEFVVNFGVTGGAPTVASPMYKQVFDLRTGACLDDPGVVLPTFPVRRSAAGDRVEVGLAHEHRQ